MMDMLPVHLWYLTDAETIGRVNECHAAYHGLSKKDLEFRKIRDVLGEHAFDQYVMGKRAEWEEFRTSVSQWEVNKYMVNY